MNRLIATAALALALVGVGADLYASAVGNPQVTAAGGPIVSFTPKPDPPCANNITSAKSAAAAAQRELAVDHGEARISVSQLKSLSGDLKQETKWADRAGDWGALCSDIGRVESRAAAE